MIEKIKWTSAMRIGVASIDEQHQSIINMINTLIEDRSSNSVSKILSEMIDFSEVHFKHEEVLIKELQYPLLDIQVNEHREFMDKTIEFCSSSLRNIKVEPSIVIDFLGEWLVDHIMFEDMQLKPFFKEKGIK